MSKPSALKKFRKRRHPIKHVELPPEKAASSEDIDDVEPTMSPHSSSRNRGNGLAIDATVAPYIGETEEQEYVATYAGLLEKYLLSGKTIPFILIIAITGWIFIQDNGAGNLTNWHAIFWTIQKCLFFIIPYVVYLGCKFISRLWKRR